MSGSRYGVVRGMVPGSRGKSNQNPEVAQIEEFARYRLVLIMRGLNRVGSIGYHIPCKGNFPHVQYLQFVKYITSTSPYETRQVTTEDNI
jgi:hypothetical protein